MSVRLNKQAPAFSCSALMPDSSEKDVKLSDYKGKWLVFFWYPLDFTFVCPTEIIEFSDRVGEFNAMGCEVLGASIDSYFSHLAWTQQDRKKGGLGKMKIPLIADLSHNIAKEYMCYLDDDNHSCRATFIIDPQGIVRHMSFNSPDVGRNTDEVLRLVAGYQHAAANPGHVCPMNWKPKGKTIDKEKKEEFFSTQ